MTTGRLPSVEGGIQPTIVDAKGDLIVATAADTVSRIAVGSNDQVLTADSSTSTGVKWATASSGGMTLLSTTTCSGTTTTVSSISGSYKNLFIEVYGVTWDTGESAFQFNTNLTSAISWERILADYAIDSQRLQTVVTPINDRVQNPKRTGGNNYHSLIINNYASTTDYKTFQLLGCYEGNDAGNDGRVLQYSGGMASDTAINSFTWGTSSSYNMTAGTIKIYGVN